MTDTSTISTAPPIAPPRPYASDPATLIADTEAYLDGCQVQALHPDRVAAQLSHAGWRDEDALLVAERYRRRFDEHRLGYAGFLFSVGFSALSAGSIGHLLLAIVDDRNPSREFLALWITVLMIAVPFALWSWTWIERTDDRDPVAAWSRPRRSLATTLLWCCGIVGGARLLVYVYSVASVVAHADEGQNLAIGLANVAVTAGITLPLGIWAFRFLHKFDRPAAPPS